MLPKFLESLGNNLAQQWIAKVLTPAFVFWFGGVGVWVWRFGWKNVEQWLTQKSEALPLTYLIGGLLIVSTSAIVVQRFELLVLRFLEGYWPRWMRPLRSWLLKRQAVQVKKSEQRFQVLASRGLEKLNSEELDEYVRLDWQLKQTPVQSDRLMPTRLGNILRAAERRSLEKYGLDAVICWPRFWLLLPDNVKTDLTETRANLNSAVRVWIWSILFLVWGIWTWWAILAGILSALLAYRWMLDAAVIYGDLVESAFDLHRTALYKSLRWPMPTNPAEERRIGEALTTYLWRGSDQSEPTFEKPEK